MNWRKDKVGYYVYLTLPFNNDEYLNTKYELHENEELTILFKENETIEVFHKTTQIGVIDNEIAHSFYTVKDYFISGLVAQIHDQFIIVRYMINHKAPVIIDPSEDPLLTKKQLKIQQLKSKQQKRIIEFTGFVWFNFFLYIIAFIVATAGVIVSLTQNEYFNALLMSVFTAVSGYYCFQQIKLKWLN